MSCELNMVYLLQWWVGPTHYASRLLSACILGIFMPQHQPIVTSTGWVKQKNETNQEMERMTKVV